MAANSNYEADRLDGVNVIGASEKQSAIAAQLRDMANLIPAYVWCAIPSGALVLFESNPQLVEVTAQRNSTLQGAYLIVAARALCLDCRPMSGFDNA